MIANALAPLATGDAAAALAALEDAFADRLATADAAAEGVPLPHAWAAGDALVARAAGLLEAAPHPAASSPDTTVFIATELYAHGGHTALLADLFSASTGQRHPILLTARRGSSATSEPFPEAAATRLGAAAAHVEITPGDTLFTRLAELAPQRIILLHHPTDVAAVAAALSIPGAARYLVHHADHTLCSGLTAPGITPVDILPYPSSYTRNILGLQNHTLPLTVPDPQIETASSLVDAPIKTATTGSPSKFSDFPPVAFARLVSTILLSTGGEHVHVGGLPATRLEELEKELSEHRIPRERFLHIPQTPSLSRTYLKEKVTLSVGSAPSGGARATIESLACGLPHLWYSPQPSQDSWRLHLQYPEAATWRSLQELGDLLEAATPEWRADQSRSARQHYLAHHHPGLLRPALDALTPIPKNTPHPDTDALLESVIASSVARNQAATHQRLEHQISRIDFLQMKRREHQEKISALKERSR